MMIQRSRVVDSDSYYLVLYPGTTAEAVIRASSHVMKVRHADLALNVSTPKKRASAVQLGLEWLEKNYGSEHQRPTNPTRASRSEVHAAIERRGLADSDIHYLRRSGHGHLQRRPKLDAVQRSDGDVLDRLGSRSAARIRASSAKSKRSRR